MKALPTAPAPCFDIFPCSQRVAFRSTSRPISLLHPKNDTIPALVADQRQRRPFYALFSHTKSIPSSISSSAQSVAEPEEVETVTSEEVTKTVHVKFELQKECEFGQRFLIVGDDPVLGVWDPAAGVPLTWTEGHLWTAQVDMPVGKLIKYKFILKSVADVITWQPGPDRILETLDTEKVLIVSEDWNNPELQNIVEGELDIETFTDTPATLEQGTDNANGAAIHQDHPPASMVAENISQQDLSSNETTVDSLNVAGPKEEEKALEGNGSAINSGNNLLSSENGSRQVTNEQEAPVLIPGLNTMPSEVIAEPELGEGDNGILDNGETVANSEEVEYNYIDEHKVTV